jgi:hypothetical protein
MNCADFLEGLVDYHFAAEPQDRREANRAHLRDCGECAQQYFDLKHDIDSGAAEDHRPSDVARARLRGEVAGLFQPGLFGRTLGRTRGWLAAPTPRYRVGAAMVAAAMAVAMLWPNRPPGAPENSESRGEVRSETKEARYYSGPKERSYVPRAMPASIVDSARVDALSITYY